ncbi:hypothetical protein B7463_g8893, partial [Scytalidium lignicola]
MRRVRYANAAKKAVLTAMFPRVAYAGMARRGVWIIDGQWDRSYPAKRHPAALLRVGYQSARCSAQPIAGVAVTNDERTPGPSLTLPPDLSTDGSTDRVDAPNPLDRSLENPALLLLKSRSFVSIPLRLSFIAHKSSLMADKAHQQA